MWTPKIAFLQPKEPAIDYRVPAPTVFPNVAGGHIAALYKAARSGGDFYDLVLTGSRMVFVLLDISGQRQEALHIAAHVQDAFRAEVPRLFGDQSANEAEGLTDLLLTLNRTIINAASGPHFSAGFLACYSLDLGTLFYINAGHTPALLKDSSGITVLEATALPLGLFSHATQDAQMCVLEPGATLLLVSRGIIESKQRRREFGLQKVREVLEKKPFHDPHQLCAVVLAAVQEFANGKSAENDLTTLALVRPAVAASLTASAGS